MQQERSLLPTGRKRVKLTSGGDPVISGFAVRNVLNNEDRDRCEQQDMDKAAFV
jgi:hypothetical protein